MMKILVTTSVGVWLDGERRTEGYKTEVESDVGKQLIDLGYASQIHTRNRKKTSDAASAK